MKAVLLASFILACLLTAMHIIATPARSQTVQPQMPCMPRAILEKQIKSQYGESVVGAGLTPVGVLYVTANPVTGTFTVVMRKDDGTACIVGGGKGWTSITPEIPGTNL
jgi:hypothetical protein